MTWEETEAKIKSLREQISQFQEDQARRFPNKLPSTRRKLVKILCMLVIILAPIGVIFQMIDVYVTQQLHSIAIISIIFAFMLFGYSVYMLVSIFANDQRGKA
jgi:hypothetical protein